MEHDFGPMKWLIWAGAFWIVCTVLFSVFWYRLARRRPVIRYEVDDAEVIEEPKL